MFSPYSSAGGTGLSRRVSLAGAVDDDELRKCISVRSGTKLKVQDLPVSGEDDDDGNAAVSAMIKVLNSINGRDPLEKSLGTVKMLLRIFWLPNKFFAEIE
ncbi:hypothetical protein ACQ4LE_002518 [Meloidogyne hapla]